MAKRMSSKEAGRFFGEEDLTNEQVIALKMLEMSESIGALTGQTAGPTTQAPEVSADTGGMRMDKTIVNMLHEDGEATEEKPLEVNSETVWVLASHGDGAWHSKPV